MSTFDNNYQFVVIISVLIIVAVIVLLALEKLYVATLTVRKQITQSVVPKFIDISPSTNSLVRC
jgi:uncharacterized membrane protein YgaE (UPF0421/DUF939 family)